MINQLYEAEGELDYCSDEYNSKGIYWSSKFIFLMSISIFGLILFFSWIIFGFTSELFLINLILVIGFLLLFLSISSIRNAVKDKEKYEELRNHEKSRLTDNISENPHRFRNYLPEIHTKFSQIIHYCSNCGKRIRSEAKIQLNKVEIIYCIYCGENRKIRI